VGLSISVGALADALEEDPDWTSYLRKQLSAVNRLLKANKLPAHKEPTELPEMNDRARLDGFPYSWLHYLRRAVAYALQKRAGFAPVAPGVNPSDDDAIDRELSDTRSHLICHSDCEGYYVPIDFPEVLYADERAFVGGGMLGSSQRALAEVLLAAPLLEIELADGKPTKTIIDTIREEEDGGHPLWLERKVWLCMHEKFRLSVEHKTAVVFH
jgi:hypothetical protein